MSGRPLKAVMLDRLMDSGTWMTREQLGAGASTCAMAIEDAVADLVLEGKAEYREAVGYRLAGSALARAAVAGLRRRGVRRHVVAQQVKDEYRAAVAEQRADLGVVMYEIAMPLAPDARGHLRQVQAVMDPAMAGFEQGVTDGR